MHKSLSLLPLLIFLSACGKSNSSAGLPKDWSTRYPSTQEVTPANAYFMADLSPLNANLTGPLRGRVTVEKSADKYKTKVNLSTSSWHKQNIYSGTRCPNLGDDANGDGVIDSREALDVAGELLMTLRNNSSTTNSSGIFELRGKIVLVEGSTEAWACGILAMVPALPAETEYQPTPRPAPTPVPTPTPEPNPNPEPERGEDEEDDDWADRFNRWWRCRFGGC